MGVTAGLGSSGWRIVVSCNPTHSLFILGQTIDLGRIAGELLKIHTGLTLEKGAGCEVSS